MPQELVIHDEKRIAKLDRLGRAARQAHERARKHAAKAMENVIRSGQLLCKARDLCDTDEWDAFLAVHFKGRERTAQRQMRLARHWSELQAFAPPEALTSQRKAFRILNTLLAGEQRPSETTTARKKRAADAALAPPAPATSAETMSSSDDTNIPIAPTGAADKEWRIAARQMHDRVLRVLERLTEELSLLSPPPFLVRQALDAIRRAHRHVADSGQKLCNAEASEQEGSVATVQNSAETDDNS